jgi:hypothetical protein
MARATISGGIYQINDIEGRAIALIVPPVAIQNINYWDTLTDIQTWKLYEMVVEWEILAHWLVSHRIKTVDTKQMPFISLEFLDQEKKAELFSVQLDLCAEIWKATEIREYYPTPYHWWVKCIKEVQQNQINTILASRDGIPKGVIEDNTRSLWKSLTQGTIPFDRSANNLHFYRMLNFAIKLRTTCDRVKDSWINYLKALKALAKELKTNNELKATTTMGRRLYYRDCNTLKAIPTERIEKDTVLDIRAGFAILD